MPNHELLHRDTSSGYFLEAFNANFSSAGELCYRGLAPEAETHSELHSVSNQYVAWNSMGFSRKEKDILQVSVPERVKFFLEKNENLVAVNQ
jgi:hypothetical protein